MSAFQFYPDLGGPVPSITGPSLGTYIIQANTQTLVLDAPTINQSFTEIKIGTDAGLVAQANNSIALGFGAGQTNQGANSIAIGVKAGQMNQHANTIVLNSSGVALNTDRSDSLFMTPIRATGTDSQLYYNTTTKEITYAPAVAGVSGTMPAGGLTNQILTKQSNTDFDTLWSSTFTGTSAYLSSFVDAPTINPYQTSVKIATNAGLTGQDGNCIAIGNSAAYSQQQANGIAIGYQAGYTGQQANSIAIGNQAGSTGQAVDSIAIGYQAGRTLQRFNSIAIGFQAGLLSQNDNCIAIGSSAGSSSQQGRAIAIGQSAGQTNQPDSAVAIGYQAGQNSMGGIAIGRTAGQSSQGASTVAIGWGAAQTSQGQESIAVGRDAGNGTQGSRCVSVGHNSGFSNQGISSVAIGYQSAYQTQGANSVAIGYQTGFTGQQTQAIAIGSLAGYQFQGTGSVAIGSSAGSTGQRQYAFAGGFSAGAQNQGANTVAIGTFAARSSQGENSIAIGPQSATSQGANSVTIGYRAGISTQAANTIAIGPEAGRSQNNRSIAIGWQAGNSQGTNCIAIGSQSSIGFSQGDNAVCIGNNAGYNSQGAGCIAIGQNAGNNSQNGTNSISIGVNAAANPFSNAISIGNNAGSSVQQANSIAIGNNAGSSTQQTNSIAIGNNAAPNTQSANSIAMGFQSGFTGQQTQAIAIGSLAGYQFQGTGSVAIGSNAGATGQGQYSFAGGFNAATLNQGFNCVAIGSNAGQNTQGNNSVAVGVSAGSTTQGAGAVALGGAAGQSSQSTNAVALGNQAATTSQGASSIAIGAQAGRNTQATNAIAIGNAAAFVNQGSHAVAIGFNSGYTGQGGNALAIGRASAAINQGLDAMAFGTNAGFAYQGANSIAIGFGAGFTGQGQNSIALGGLAGYTGQHANTIILNASGGFLNSNGENRLFMAPIRNTGNLGTPNALYYDTTSKEIYYDVSSGGAGSTGPTGQIGLAGITSGLVLYFDTNSGTSPVSGDLFYIPNVGTQSIVSTNVNSSSGTQVGSFVTNVNVPGVTAVVGGNWDLWLYAKTSSANIYFWAVIQEVQSDGSTVIQTLVNGSYATGTAVLTTSSSLYQYTAYVPVTTLSSTSSRIRVTIYAQSVTGSPTFTSYYRDGTISFIVTSISANIVGPTGPTGNSNLPLSFLPPTTTGISITDPSPTLIRTNVSFQAGTPTDGFTKTLINGYTGNNLLNALSTDINALIPNNINAIAGANNKVFFGGSFTTNNGNTGGYSFLAKWDPQNGLQRLLPGPTGPNSGITSLVYDEPSNLLYVGGSFSQWAGATALRMGVYNIGTDTFQMLGGTGPNDPPSALALNKNTNELYVSLANTNVNSNFLIWNGATWSGRTGLNNGTNGVSQLVHDPVNNVVYQQGSTFVNLSTPTSNTIITPQIAASFAITNVVVDNTGNAYISINNTSAVNTPFRLTAGNNLLTYQYGQTGLAQSIPQKILSGVASMAFDQNTNKIYLCANTTNSSNTFIIDQKSFSSIVRYDGSTFTNVADFSPLVPMVHVGNNNIMFGLTKGTAPIVFQPSKTASINPLYIGGAGMLDMNASLTITAPINYYDGSTGSSYTLMTKGEKVEMKWSSQTNSWWV